MALWDPENPDVTQAHRDMAKVLKGRLIYEAGVAGELEKNSHPKDTERYLRYVGIAVMRGHAQAVARDYSQKLGDRWGVLDKYQGAIFHHKVFTKLNLPASVYGGTPFGSGQWVPLVSFQAWMTNQISNLPNFPVVTSGPGGLTTINSWCGYMCFGQGYISNEDNHHDASK
ncbi:hypothetical protein [Aliikangiella maris]|uniref:Uncharacterized protein n=1 Tax=Aliikangiella maris TaxID=3162458 RepID=A0ABV2BZX2_9GAMM